jgi:murein DD-endopeptidase MepM/ murein hydrolase activator NlpD
MLAVFAVLLACRVGPALSAPDVSATGSAVSVSATTTLEDDFSDIINGYQKQIQAKKDAIDQMKAQMDAYQKQIDTERETAASLDNQLALVGNKVAQTQIDINSNQDEIDATNLEIASLQEQIEDKTRKIMSQRDLIGDFLRAIQKSDARTPMDLLLTEKTISDFFNDVQFLQESQRELKNAIDVATTLKTDLEDRETQQSAKRQHLEDIVTALKDDQVSLTEDQQAKQALQDQSQVAAARYSYELASLKREANNANSDITEIDKRLRKTLNDQKLQQLSGGPGGWGWPVDPSRGISAYFHDPDYPFRYVFEHPAIDIRTAQGTPVKAAKGGYVATAKDAGMGYSYVMIIHDNNMSTVYGHLSRIIAQADTYVEKGDIIGYSGGTPGTPGAGLLTTGPHLHLEFRVAGIPVDPLGYLKLP